MPASSNEASGLAKRYATALFELARSQDTLDPVAQDLAGLAELYDNSEDLRRLVRSPVLSRVQQGRGISAVAEQMGAQKLTRNFLGVLAEKRRLFALPEVISAYQAMLRRHRGEVSAEVTAATELSEDQMQAVRAQLRQVTGKDVDLTLRVDPDLLGGLIVRLGSRMIDASLRSKLQRLELSMKGTG